MIKLKSMLESINESKLHENNDFETALKDAFVAGYKTAANLFYEFSPAYHTSYDHTRDAETRWETYKKKIKTNPYDDHSEDIEDVSGDAI